MVGHSASFCQPGGVWTESQAGLCWRSLREAVWYRQSCPCTISLSSDLETGSFNGDSPGVLPFPGLPQHIWLTTGRNLGTALLCHLPLTLVPSFPAGSTTPRDRGLCLPRRRDWQPCLQPKSLLQGMPGPGDMEPASFSPLPHLCHGNLIDPRTGPLTIDCAVPTSWPSSWEDWQL